MEFFFGGGENTTYRRMLMERGVERIAVNYAYAKNNLPRSLDEEEWPSVIAYCSAPREDYHAWVVTNASRLDLAIVHQWGDEWKDLGLSVPLWDGGEPVRFMQMMAETPSGWVAVSAKAARASESMIRQASFQGIKLFGLGISSIKLWDRCHFDAVANTDWSLAYQRREAQLLDPGGHIHRYRDDRLPVVAEDFGRQASTILEGTERGLGDVLSGDRDALVSLSVSAWLGAERFWDDSPRNVIHLVPTPVSDTPGSQEARPKPDRPALPSDARVFSVGSEPLIRRPDRKLIPVVSSESPWWRPQHR